MKNSKRLSVGALMLCFALLGAAFIGGTADAKKKKKKTTVTVTKTNAGAIPNAIQINPSRQLDGKLDVPLTVGKKVKGTAGRVSITVQTLGAATNPAEPTDQAGDDIVAELIAPDGTTVGLFGFVGGGSGLETQSIGPLSIIPNSPIGACSVEPAPATPPPPPCENPDSTLLPPYAGTIGNSELNLFEGVKMRGTWIARFFDDDSQFPRPALTSSVSLVKLVIKRQKPVL